MPAQIGVSSGVVSLALDLFGIDSFIGGFGQILIFILFIFFFPRLMMMQSLYKLRAALKELEAYAEASETVFLKAIDPRPTKALRDKLFPMKNLAISPPTTLDPAGLVGRLELVLDSAEDRMVQFIEEIAPDRSVDEKANLTMAFKGVYGTYHIYMVLRHFEQIISKTDNIQLAAMLQMFIPVYKEVAEAQKDATKAFVKEIPIGDSIGPMCAAALLESKPKEIAKDIMFGTGKFGTKEVLVLKSNGPGSRLGKYGNAVQDIAKRYKVKKILTVDAGIRLEGEATGKVVEGVGVMMGGPGVEKSKIEMVATELGVPLEGIIVKMSAPQASRFMPRAVFKAKDSAVSLIQKIVERTDGTVLVIGVGNTVGIGNMASEIEGVDKKLKSYWKKDNTEETSYFQMMRGFAGQAISPFNLNRLGGVSS